MKYIIIFIFILYTGSITAVPAKRIWNGGIPDEPMLHVCMLFVVNDNPAVGYLGGGTIISNRHVLTAAHVLQNAIDINIGYGSNTRADMDTRSTRTFFIHGDFDPTNRANDIAIIVLTGPTFADALYKAAKLPQAGTVPPTIGTVAGFGFYTPDAQIPDVLQYAELHVVGDNYCERFREATDQTHHFCVKSPNQIPSHLCPGDNGIGFFTIETIVNGNDEGENGEGGNGESGNGEGGNGESGNGEGGNGESGNGEGGNGESGNGEGGNGESGNGEGTEESEEEEDEEEEAAVLFGIASFIVQGCTWQDQPALFIEVAPYLSWIQIFV